MFRVNATSHAGCWEFQWIYMQAKCVRILTCNTGHIAIDNYSKAAPESLGEGHKMIRPHGNWVACGH